jgi:hypothetical protein
VVACTVIAITKGSVKSDDPAVMVNGIS